MNWRSSFAAFWRILRFYLVTGAAMGVLAGIAILALRLSGRHPHLMSPAKLTTIEAPELLLVEALTFSGLVVAMVLTARWERRTLADFGFPWRRLFTRPFWSGAGAGFGAIVVVVLAMMASGSAHVSGLATHGAALAGHALLWAMTFLLVGLSEELFFRGYPQFTLAANVGFWRGAIAMTVLFTVMHTFNAGETPVGIAGVFAIGLLFCFALRRLGDLRWPIGFHAAWDWGQTCFFGTSDSGLFASGSILHTETSGPSLLSGGSAGPEATIFALVVLAIIAFGLHRTTAAAAQTPASLAEREVGVGG